MADLSSEELSHVLETARALKAGLRPVPQRQAGSPSGASESAKRTGQATNETMRSGGGDSRRLLAGKTLALLFEKPSLRTRVSFDVGMRQLGGDCIYVSPAEVGLGTREPVEDVARVMSRYVDCIAARTFAQETVEQLARWADVPVINALSESEHPCQALADLLTILEHKGRLEGVSLAYIGDGNNVARSLALGAVMMGMEFRIATPEGYELDEKTVSRSEELARESGGGIVCVREAKEAAAAADVVYTDVWASMGQEEEATQRREAFDGYQVDAKLMSMAAPEAIFMHDLPAHRGEEVSEEVFESTQSVVFDQAENRLHAQKGALALILGEESN
ncbi:MAG: ornithine carbamoyltransferase [Chloroflexi bacterium]|nr:ornithine carbamoyltransferase [Chloroflexota bacterium]